MPFAMRILALSLAIAWGQSPTLSSKYPKDAGLGGDAAVIFFEDFEKNSLAEVSARWNETHNGAGMSLVTDIPSVAAAGGKSIRMTSVGGSNDGGHLFKRLNPGVTTLYLRFYLKYATGGTYHHSGAGLGGYNPPTNWPQGNAGVKPTGSDRIVVNAERITGSNPTFDYYTYWMEMRGNPADNNFWGNTFINNPQVQIPAATWTCVEYMVKLNDPVTEHNGEAAMWIDGQQVSHLGPGFPKGRWTWDRFIPDSAGQPFEGFRWRSTTNLNLNWMRVSHYVTQDPAGYVGQIWYDQVVAATARIGCIGSGAGIRPKGARPQRKAGPALMLGPGSVVVFARESALAEDSEIRVTDMAGRNIPIASLSRPF
jgi:hypothetical protein